MGSLAIIWVPVILVAGVYLFIHPFRIGKRRWGVGSGSIATLYIAIGIIIVIVLGGKMGTNYLRYNYKCKHSGAKVNLGGIYKHQEAYFLEENEYAETF